jgi:hypothetical protein
MNDSSSCAVSLSKKRSNRQPLAVGGRGTVVKLSNRWVISGVVVLAAVAILLVVLYGGGGGSGVGTGGGY